MKVERCWCDRCEKEIIDENIFCSDDWEEYCILNFMHFMLDAFKRYKSLNDDHIIKANKYHLCKKCQNKVLKIENYLREIYHEKIRFIDYFMQNEAKIRFRKLNFGGKNVHNN
jgi:hypothetical protein